MRAVGAARRDGESQPLPVFGGLVEILHHDHGVIDTDDVFECHAFILGAEATYQAKQIDPPPQEIRTERPDRKPERSTLEFSASTSLLAKVEKRSEEGTEIAGKACQKGISPHRTQFHALQRLKN
jgi:hypothetical protein